MNGTGRDLILLRHDMKVPLFVWSNSQIVSDQRPDEKPGQRERQRRVLPSGSALISKTIKKYPIRRDAKCFQSGQTGINHGRRPAQVRLMTGRLSGHDGIRQPATEALPVAVFRLVGENRCKGETSSPAASHCIEFIKEIQVIPGTRAEHQLNRAGVLTARQRAFENRDNG